jgi:hypothetical protein
MRSLIIKRLSGSLLAGLFLLPSLTFGQASEELEAKDLFAVVNGEEIGLDSYQYSIANAGKKRFYHGKAPENELEAFKYEVGQGLINTTLLLQEAARQEIPIDREWVESRLETLIERFKRDPRWEKDKDTVISDLRDRLGKQSRLNALEEKAKEIAPPTDAQIEGYYLKHPDKFTTPGRIRVSNILLKVAPWAPQDAWESAKALAERLEKDIRNGADFAEIAREFSQDQTADEGGDMGYLHMGMLGDSVENALAELKVGEMTKPIQLLEGYGLFRLVDREPAKLNELSEVKERAAQLWLREAKEKAYQNLLDTLREKSSVEIKDAKYLELIGKYEDQPQEETRVKE